MRRNGKRTETPLFKSRKRSMWPKKREKKVVKGMGRTFGGRGVYGLV